MPVYDYLCSNCRETTEVIHGIDAPGPRFCPSCGAEGTLRKAFAPPTVHFKGSGWAKKDRSTAMRARAKQDTAADSGTGKAGASGGDASASTDKSSNDKSSSDGSSTDKASTKSTSKATDGSTSSGSSGSSSPDAAKG